MLVLVVEIGDKPKGIMKEKYLRLKDNDTLRKVKLPKGSRIVSIRRYE